jgi:outer membrane protein TolC
MRRPATGRIACALRGAAGVLALVVVGCTPLTEYVHNGFKVGPNFKPPPAAPAPDWIDRDLRVVRAPAECAAWWHVFGDPVLDSLIDTAQKQNLDLRTAATRVLQAQAQRNIAAGYLLPKTQNLLGAYAHGQTSQNGGLIPGLTAPAGVPGLSNIFNVWVTGFNVSWELDFWGRVRRNIESRNAELDASIEAYRAAMVTLQADVATAYIQLRTLQQRVAFARRNVEVQEGSLKLAQTRFREGRATALDVEQALSTVSQTEATTAKLAISLR